MMYEDNFCDECGRPMQRIGGRYKCHGCDADYAQGTADYHAWKDAQLIGGEDLAVRMEMEAEYGYMG